MTNTEKWELDAMLYAQLEEMPDELNAETPVWIFAIAETITYRMEHSFAIVRNSYGETPSIIKSFGEGGISSIEKIYPYKFLDKKYVPEVKGEAEMRNLLAKVYGVEKPELAKIKKEILPRLFYNYCMKRQLADEKDKAKAKSERDAAQALRDNNDNNKQQNKE